ncbi:hypothetical protein Rsub_02494 [Raphidocelis subcapitata]|uniref:Uncharacterized protein n=1 Tax=Raphidocelis subcapitata TaxID=307507 RepID=A0A2V0NRU1_9CHLO|nr:hypothetical protein Rsub_02494 [Raphidocelis subcapitata]|eukprot:GBF90388.1 hypothetical protein Rsub_02494 [Raphidocelis subcapitata]
MAPRAPLAWLLPLAVLLASFNLSTATFGIPEPVFNRLNASAAELARAKAAALVALSSSLLRASNGNGTAPECANGAPLRNCAARQPDGCAACRGERQVCALNSCGGCEALCFDWSPAAVLGLPENFNPIGTGIMGGILAAIKKASA